MAPDPPWLRRAASLFSRTGTFTCETHETWRKLEIPVVHAFAPPLEPGRRTRIERALPHRLPPDLQAFYDRCDGALLYTRSMRPGEAQGLAIFPLSELTSRHRRAVREMSDGPESLPERCLVFGEPVASGNYLALDAKARGREKSVLYLDHETLFEPEPPRPLFRSFRALLEAAMKDPARLLNDRLGCFARYSDGKTERQWIPLRYRPDQSDGA